MKKTFEAVFEMTDGELAAWDLWRQRVIDAGFEVGRHLPEKINWGMVGPDHAVFDAVARGCANIRGDRMVSGGSVPPGVVIVMQSDVMRLTVLDERVHVCLELWFYSAVVPTTTHEMRARVTEWDLGITASS